MVGYSFLGDSFIRNSTPVYPDAICPFRRLHTFHFLRPARLRTPLLRYGAPHLSARGTSTLLNNALLSAHFLFADKPPGISVSLQVEHKQFIGNGQLIGSSLR